MDKFTKNLTSKKWAVILISLGTITWSLTMVKSGWVYSYGMGFWGPNGHDGIWHISIIESLSRGSLGMPIFAGETLSNYHFGFDLLLAFIHKLTFIPVVNLYFQIIPPLLAIGVGLSCYMFVNGWKRSDQAALWATFIVYFGGSLGWLVNMLRDNGYQGESMFWSQQSISTLVNPPFALSLIILFVGLNVLRSSLETDSRNRLGLVIIVFGLLIAVKVYAGLLVNSGLMIAGLFGVSRFRDFRLLKVFIGTLILSLLLLIPTLDISKSLIEYKPFWFLETMMAFPDRFGWDKYYMAMTTFRQGQLWMKAILTYVIAFSIFMLGNFGTRAIGLLYIVGKLKRLRSIDYLDTILSTMIVAGVLAPMFFVQKGTPWNTIQLLYYSLIFSGVLAGIEISKLIRGSKSKLLKTSITLIVVMITIPTTIATLYYHYLPSRPPAMLSISELEALSFLREQPVGIVYVDPFDKSLADSEINNPPRPLSLYESTAYLSAFSGKDVWLEDEVNLNITGYDWQSRRFYANNILDPVNYGAYIDFLVSKNISYLYDYGKRHNMSRFDFQNDVFNLVFENDEVSMYRIGS